MKLPVQKFARLWQFVGVAIATHAATRHAMIWGHPDTHTEADVAASWIRLFIGVGVAIVLFWTGVYFEGREASAKPSR
jgi:hypothetical protein